MINNSAKITARSTGVARIPYLGLLQVIHKHSARPVKIPAFWGAMEHLGFTGREGRAVLAHLSARMYMIVFPDEDGHVAGISLVPQQYRCWQCNGLLNMQDDIRLHFDDCRKRQAKIERNRKLL